MGKKWKRRRYEIAKDIMAAYISNGSIPLDYEDSRIAKWSVDAADALIKRLKR